MENLALVSTEVWGLALEVRLFGAISAFISFFIYPIYIRSMVVGEQSPPRSSWFLWSLLNLISFSGKFADGTFDAMLFIYVVGTISVAVTTIFYGQKGWTRLETYCSTFVLLAVAVWEIVGPSVAVICSMSGTTVAMLPLLRRVLRGEYENIRAWSIAVTGGFFNLLDGQIMVSLWFMILQSTVVLSVYYHHHLPKHRTSGT